MRNITWPNSDMLVALLISKRDTFTALRNILYPISAKIFQVHNIFELPWNLGEMRYNFQTDTVRKEKISSYFGIHFSSGEIIFSYLKFPSYASGYS